MRASFDASIMITFQEKVKKLRQVTITQTHGLEIRAGHGDGRKYALQGSHGIGQCYWNSLARAAGGGRMKGVTASTERLLDSK